MTQPDIRPKVGACQHIEPGLRCVLAPNPSSMTHWGTNTYILGTGSLAVIDPGPDNPAHLAAILAALTPGERISHIFVTHAHLDHSPLARALAAETTAPIHAFGPATAGRSALMQGLAEQGIGGGEGVDIDFAPDHLLGDGDIIADEGWQIETIHTPGHFAGHLCFAWQGRLFCGDHVMGWSSSLISPPDGDMRAYMASLDRLGQRRWRIGYSAHGAAIPDVAARLLELTRHRQAREAAVRHALALGHHNLTVLTDAVYTDVVPALIPAARRNLFAHLIDLTERNIVSAIPHLHPDARFDLC